MKGKNGPEGLEACYRAGMTRKFLIVSAIATGCIVVAGLSLTINGRGIGFLDCYGYMIRHICGTVYEFGTDEWFDDYVLWNIYAPRVAIAVVCGCGLSVGGTLMQAVLSNPLADPYTTGVSDGATLGASVAIITGLSFSTAAGSMGIVTNAFVGAIMPAAILVILNGFVRMTPATCILVGTALSGIFGGVQTLLMYGADPDTLTAALRWGIGTFSQTSWEDCIVPVSATVAGIAASFPLCRRLNLLALGDESAKSLGLETEKFKALCMVLATVVVASIICYVGIIGFVGLIAPHAVRMLMGGDNRFVLPASMMAGSFLLLASDLLSRVLIYPEELRVGVVMSIIGAPVFLYMIVSRRHGYGEGFRCGPDATAWKASTAGPSDAKGAPSASWPRSSSPRDFTASRYPGWKAWSSPTPWISSYPI